MNNLLQWFVVGGLSAPILLWLEYRMSGRTMRDADEFRRAEKRGITLPQLTFKSNWPTFLGYLVLFTLGGYFTLIATVLVILTLGVIGLLPREK